MTEATCKREIELEIPADNVQKATEKVARDIARIARIPGFRPGKAPITLVRRRFADDIQGEVVQSLVPEYLEKALDEKKLVPVTRPEVDKVEFKEGEPLKFRAIFEVLPEFELGDYKNLQVQVDEIEAGDAQVEKTIEEMRERAATFVPVEGRAAKDGDSVLIKLKGVPTERRRTGRGRQRSGPARRGRNSRELYRKPARRECRRNQDISKRSIRTIIPIRSWPERPTTSPWTFRASRKRSFPS